MDRLFNINSDEIEFMDMIDMMSTEERREFKDILIKTAGVNVELPANLFYNYETQEWIV